MSNIGNKISHFRNLNGFSQEVLADKSGLNIRTIQRIEKGETDPRGDSIQRLCNALEISPEEIIEWQQVEDRGYLTALQLSALSFLLFPLLGITVPLIPQEGDCCLKPGYPGASLTGSPFSSIR